MKEPVDIVDNTNHKLGIVRERTEARQQGLWHRVVAVWLIDTSGKLILQKRGTGARSHVGLWDASASGAVDAGEATRDAAVRELHEELGLRLLPADLIKGGVYKSGSSPEKKSNSCAFVHNYFVRYMGNLNDVRFTDEVAGVRSITPGELQAMLSDPVLYSQLYPKGRDFYFSVLKDMQELGL